MSVCSNRASLARIHLVAVIPCVAFARSGGCAVTRRVRIGSTCNASARTGITFVCSGIARRAHATVWACIPCVTDARYATATRRTCIVGTCQTRCSSRRRRVCSRGTRDTRNHVDLVLVLSRTTSNASKVIVAVMPCVACARFRGCALTRRIRIGSTVNARRHAVRICVF
jgi:hypothetical protein